MLGQVLVTIELFQPWMQIPAEIFELMQAGEHMLWKGSRYTQPDIQINVPTVLTDRCGQKVNGRLPKRLLAWTEAVGDG